jgi:hypothetical protein
MTAAGSTSAGSRAAALARAAGAVPRACGGRRAGAAVRGSGGLAGRVPRRGRRLRRWPLADGQLPRRRLPHRPAHGGRAAADGYAVAEDEPGALAGCTDGLLHLGQQPLCAESDGRRAAAGDGRPDGSGAGEPRPPQGQRRFLVDQQRELFEHIRVRAAQREEQEARTRAREESAPRRTVHLQREERVASLAIEPGGRYAVVSTAFTTQSSARRTQIPFWVTESGYVEAREFRTHVGDEQGSGGRMGIVSLRDGDVRWLDVAAATRPPEAADSAPRSAPPGSWAGTMRARPAWSVRRAPTSRRRGSGRWTRRPAA